MIALTDHRYRWNNIPSYRLTGHPSCPTDQIQTDQLTTTPVTKKISHISIHSTKYIIFDLFYLIRNDQNSKHYKPLQNENNIYHYPLHSWVFNICSKSTTYNFQFYRKSSGKHLYVQLFAGRC